jgi:hypothetical protein
MLARRCIAGFQAYTFGAAAPKRPGIRTHTLTGTNVSAGRESTAMRHA